MLLWSRSALVGVGLCWLAAAAAHKRRQYGWIVHTPVEMSKQRSWATSYTSRAIATIFICTSYPDRKRFHLQLFHSSDAFFSIHMLNSLHMVLATVAEVAVLLPVLLHEVMDRPQPESGSRATRNPLGTLTVSIPTAVTAISTSIRVQFFTSLTVKKRQTV